MNRFTLALGSNLGNPQENLKLCVREIQKFSKVLEVAPCFETAPLLPAQAPQEWFSFFVNSCITIETPLRAQEVLKNCQAIETLLGRSSQREKWSPRTLDIDILFSHPLTELKSSELTLPHPSWRERTFVLAPLMHLTPPEGMPESPLFLSRKVTGMPPALMAALNVTPDSFSQTETKIDHQKLIDSLKSLLDQNIAFIDIGAESTRPGAQPLTDDEEWMRLEPLLNFWKTVKKDYPFTKLSLDTYHPKTAQKALDYSIDILNDVTHLSHPAMREVASHYSSIILMHSLTVPADKDIVLPLGTDVISELKHWFFEKMDALQHISLNKFIFDPGLCFGKTSLQSLEILKHIDELKDLPVRRLIGHSRKSFMNLWTDQPNHSRDIETLSISLKLAQKNIEILRVHNVELHRRAFRASQALEIL